MKKSEFAGSGRRTPERAKRYKDGIEPVNVAQIKQKITIRINYFWWCRVNSGKEAQERRIFGFVCVCGLWPCKLSMVVLAIPFELHDDGSIVRKPREVIS